MKDGVLMRAGFAECDPIRELLGAEPASEARAIGRFVPCYNTIRYRTRQYYTLLAILVLQGMSRARRREGLRQGVVESERRVEA